MPSSVGRFFRPVAVTRPADLDLVRFLLVAYGFEAAYELGSIFCKVQDVMSTLFAHRFPWFGLPNAIGVLKVPLNP